MAPRITDGAPRSVRESERVSRVNFGPHTDAELKRAKQIAQQVAAAIAQPIAAALRNGGERPAMVLDFTRAGSVSDGCTVVVNIAGKRAANDG